MQWHCDGQILQGDIGGACVDIHWRGGARQPVVDLLVLEQRAWLCLLQGNIDRAPPAPEAGMLRRARDRALDPAAAITGLALRRPPG